MELGYLITNTISIVITLLVNIIYTFGCCNRVKSTKEVSERHRVLITPSNFAFNIWQLIYTSIIVWNVMGYVYYYNSGLGVQLSTVNNSGVFYALATLFSVTWLIVWGSDLVVYACPILFLYTGCIFVIYRQCQVSYFPNNTVVEIFIEFIPISLHLGWLIIASIENVFVAVLSDHSGSTMSIHQQNRSIQNSLEFEIGQSTYELYEYQVKAGFISIAFVFVTSLLFIYFTNDIVVILVFCWGLFGIYMNQRKNNAMFPKQTSEKLSGYIGRLCLYGIVLMLLISIVTFVFRYEFS
jgi:hypothetical protein